MVFIPSLQVMKKVYREPTKNLPEASTIEPILTASLDSFPERIAYKGVRSETAVDGASS